MITTVLYYWFYTTPVSKDWWESTRLIMVIFILLFAAFLFNSEKMRKTQYKLIWFELEIFLFSVEPTDTHQNFLLLLGYYF